MRETWSLSLAWWHRHPIRDSTVESVQRDLLRKFVFILRACLTPADLEANANDDRRWATVVSRQDHGYMMTVRIGVPMLLNTAYAIRYVELLTNKVIDPGSLPSWIGEFEA